ncbi:NusG domain II-containing protein [Clostridium sp. MT-14]|uniref:NusG domain II-containing protein n=1 Tax=Clostridium aromativorans TaxID=2836848 RepID=A0ABS8N7A7_9CLOT|nr:MULTISPECIES: NusG domain II-containing protein [Clostridium]KAA8670990.1 NusG domain II-containing protein [Clostridium sp. HV4-5-A1G]MCC9295691.1 NusG domain II-containing protein [Clostridium aromativorans]CAB1243186.1 NusG_II domain-containing protein [Clostridiaceae bacterium BL-3]
MKKGDKIAAICILILIISSFIGVFSYRLYVKGSHKIAVIKQEGKIINTIDLNKVKGRKQFKIKYKTSHFNLVEVENGKIRIEDADCPDKICIKTGWISKPGESIICLPHKLIINIEGKNSKYDGLSN